jgi:hypothetical protein
MNMVVSVIPASIAIAIMRRAISAVSGTMTGVLPMSTIHSSGNAYCNSQFSEESKFRGWLDWLIIVFFVDVRRKCIFTVLFVVSASDKMQENAG